MTNSFVTSTKPQIKTGTAGWSDKSFAQGGTFYPRGCNSAEQRLRYYASQFSMVEIDSSYYALPPAEYVLRWIERTPDDFTFNIKAFRIFTSHQTPVATLPPDIRVHIQNTEKRMIFYRDLSVEIREELWQRFLQIIQPLRDSGKLGVVHLQFPPWVVPENSWHSHIVECANYLSGYPLSVEFRHQSWFDEKHCDETIAFERKNNLCHVVVDCPQGFENSVPQVWTHGSDRLTIVRFHGRNTRYWNAKGKAASLHRFDYNYSDEELADFIEPICKLCQQTTCIQLVFNNMFEHGQHNAKTLRRMLSEAGIHADIS